MPCESGLVWGKHSLSVSPFCGKRFAIGGMTGVGLSLRFLTTSRLVSFERSKGLLRLPKFQLYGLADRLPGGDSWRLLRADFSPNSETMRKVIAKLNQRFFVCETCPDIDWEQVVRIEAVGTDAMSEFQVWLTFVYSDERSFEVAPDMTGYWVIIRLLPARFPSIPATWYEDMLKESAHVERTFYRAP